MKSLPLFLTFALCLAFPMHSFAKNVEGTYKIDKKKLLAVSYKHIDQRKMSPAHKAKARKFVTAMLQSMQMQLSFHKGGKYTSQVSMMLMGMPKKSKSTGSWSQKGNLLIIHSVTKKKNRVVKRLIHCKVKGKQLACNQPKRKRQQIMYFRKVK